MAEQSSGSRSEAKNDVNSNDKDVGKLPEPSSSLQVLDQMLSNLKMSNCYEDQVMKLISAWEQMLVVSHATHQIDSYCIKLYRRTLVHILDHRYQALKSVIQTHLLMTMRRCSNTFMQASKSDAQQKCMTIVRLCSPPGPWSSHMIREILCGANPITVEFVDNYGKIESIEVVKARVQSLLHAEKLEMALRLCNVCVRHSSMCQDLFFIDTQLLLMQRLGQVLDIAKAVQNKSCNDGVNIIQRMFTNGIKSRDGDKVSLAECLCNIFLLQDVLNCDNNCCTKKLMQLWCMIHVYLSTGPEALAHQVKKIFKKLKDAASNTHFYLFVDVIYKEFGIPVRPLCIELYTRVLTYDLNLLEAATHKDNMSAENQIKEHLADVFTRMVNLVKDNDLLSRECLLTAYSLKPTTKRLNMLEVIALKYQAKEYIMQDDKLMERLIVPHECHCEPDTRCSSPLEEQKLIEAPEANKAFAFDSSSDSFCLVPTELLLVQVGGLSKHLLQDLTSVLEVPRAWQLRWTRVWADMKQRCLEYEYKLLNSTRITQVPTYKEQLNMFITSVKSSDTDTASETEGFEQGKQQPVIEKPNETTNAPSKDLKDFRLNQLRAAVTSTTSTSASIASTTSTSASITSTSATVAPSTALPVCPPSPPFKNLFQNLSKANHKLPSYANMQKSSTSSPTVVTTATPTNVISSNSVTAAPKKPVYAIKNTSPSVRALNNVPKVSTVKLPTLGQPRQAAPTKQQLPQKNVINGATVPFRKKVTMPSQTGKPKPTIIAYIDENGKVQFVEKEKFAAMQQQSVKPAPAKAVPPSVKKPVVPATSKPAVVNSAREGLATSISDIVARHIEIQKQALLKEKEMLNNNQLRNRVQKSRSKRNIILPRNSQIETESKIVKNIPPSITQPSSSPGVKLTLSSDQSPGSQTAFKTLEHLLNDFEKSCGREPKPHQDPSIQKLPSFQDMFSSHLRAPIVKQDPAPVVQSLVMQNVNVVTPITNQIFMAPTQPVIVSSPVIVPTPMQINPIPSSHIQVPSTFLVPSQPVFVSDGNFMEHQFAEQLPFVSNEVVIPCETETNHIPVPPSDNISSTVQCTVPVDQPVEISVPSSELADIPCETETNHIPVPPSDNISSTIQCTVPVDQPVEISDPSSELADISPSKSISPELNPWALKDDQKAPTESKEISLTNDLTNDLTDFMQKINDLHPTDNPELPVPPKSDLSQLSSSSDDFEQNDSPSSVINFVASSLQTNDSCGDDHSSSALDDYTENSEGTCDSAQCDEKKVLSPAIVLPKVENVSNDRIQAFLNDATDQIKNLEAAKFVNGASEVAVETKNKASDTSAPESDASSSSSSKFRWFGIRQNNSTMRFGKAYNKESPYNHRKDNENKKPATIESIKINTFIKKGDETIISIKLPKKSPPIDLAQLRSELYHVKNKDMINDNKDVLSTVPKVILSKVTQPEQSPEDEVPEYRTRSSTREKKSTQCLKEELNPDMKHTEVIPTKREEERRGRPRGSFKIKGRPTKGYIPVGVVNKENYLKKMKAVWADEKVPHEKESRNKKPVNGMKTRYINKRRHSDDSVSVKRQRLEPKNVNEATVVEPTRRSGRLRKVKIYD